MLFAHNGCSSQSSILPKIFRRHQTQLEIVLHEDAIEQARIFCICSLGWRDIGQSPDNFSDFVFSKRNSYFLIVCWTIDGDRGLFVAVITHQFPPESAHLSLLPTDENLGHRLVRPFVLGYA